MKRGAGGETRTLMSVTSPDFESGAYTNFATPARWALRLCQAILGGGMLNRQPLKTSIHRLGPASPPSPKAHKISL